MASSIVALAGQNAPAYRADEGIFFAEPNIRLVSQFLSIQQAIDSLPLEGGTVVVPAGVYGVTQCIDPGLKRIVLQGRGWKTTTPQATFGDARWQTSVTGSVIKVLGSAGICISQEGASHLSVRDIAIVGVGLQDSVGIDMRSPSTYLHAFHGVMVANLGIGVRLKNVLDSDFSGLQVFGNEVGILLTQVANELIFHSPRFEGNGTAMVLNGGQGVHFFGGLVQANRAGILFFPEDGPMAFAGSFEGLWFEANSTYDLRFDSSRFPVGSITFRNNRHAGAGKLIQFAGTNSTNRIYFENLEAGGVELVIPPTSSNAKVDSSTFASIADEGQLTIILNDPILGRGKLGVMSLVANQAIETGGGVSLKTSADRPPCSTATRGLLWISKGGAMVADRLSVCIKTGFDGFEWKDLN